MKNKSIAQYIKLRGVKKLPLIHNAPKFHYINKSNLQNKSADQQKKINSIKIFT